MISFEIHVNTNKNLKKLFRFILMSSAFEFLFSILYVFINVYM